MHCKAILISLVTLTSSVFTLPTGDNEARDTCLGSIGCIAGTQYCSYNGQLTSLHIPCTEEKRTCPPIDSVNPVCGALCTYGFDSCRDGTVRCVTFGAFGTIYNTGVPC